MVLYRSNLTGGDGDFSVTYTMTVNGSIQKGSCAYKYANNTSFNSPVIIGNNVNLATRMFAGCTAFNQDIVFPSSVINLNYALERCTGFGKNIYIQSKSTSLGVGGLLAECSNSKRKNVWFNSAVNNRMNITGTFSIIGDTITWTSMTNGFYNSTYNIYCYYNY